MLREDVGRHNAVDKVIGRALLDGPLPLARSSCWSPGERSKSCRRRSPGIPLLAAVSAPSILAVELAGASGITLVGFLRGAGANVYTHPQRVRPG